MVNATAGRVYQAYDCIVYFEARLLSPHSVRIRLRKTVFYSPISTHAIFHHGAFIFCHVMCHISIDTFHCLNRETL